MNTRTRNLSTLVTASALLLCAGAGRAQVVINEIYCNPVGTGSDLRNEYIELYGAPGTPLTGYMIACVFGGGDQNRNGIPGPRPSSWAYGVEMPVIQNAFQLDGLSIGSNGFCVIYNDLAGDSTIPATLPPQTTRRGFSAAHIALAGTPPAANIQNKGSQAYMLIRKRPLHSVNAATGQSVYAAGYAWINGTNPDVNFDEQVDLNRVGRLPNNTVPPAEVPVSSETPDLPPTPGPRTLEPYQITDEVGSKHSGGVLLLRDGENKISDTPGGNPDAYSRVHYFGPGNPALGFRFNTAFSLIPTHRADEEFVYGEINSSTAFTFDQLRAGGPTDQAGLRYDVFGTPDPNDTYLVDDINIAGFHLTPGTFNDVNSVPSGGTNILQFRFTRGDFNFDGLVTQDDVALIQSRLGATLNDTAPFTDPRGTTDPADDVTIANAWKWQGRDFQALLMMIGMNASDGPGGANALAVTAADVAATQDLVVVACPADFNADGVVNPDDLADFIGAYFASPPGPADFNADSVINPDDLADFIGAFFGPAC